MNLRKPVLFLLCLCLLPSMILLWNVAARAGPIGVLYAQIEGGIGPAQVRMLEDVIERAGDENHSLILLRLDTPGGLGASMRDMIKIMMNSDRPVCVWVGPEGAQAASAGTFLVAAAQVAAMAPGTTIGAASPVSPSGDDLPGTMSRKVKNDMTSLIKGIADKRGRNAQWYVSSVSQGVSLDSASAVSLHVVDFIAVSAHDFLEQLGARGIKTSSGKIRFSMSEVDLMTYDPGFSYSVLSWLLDPQIAYFLLLGGILGLFIELSHPGTVLPGVVGGFCLLTGLYAMSMLPTNAAGLLLILFGAVLFILEVFIVSYGLLSIAACISLFVGSVVLFRGGELQQIPLPTIVGTVVSFSSFAVLLIYLVTRAQMRRPGVGIETMIGQAGVVIESGEHQMKVRVRGEVWNAVADDGEVFDCGTEVSIVQADGLVLTIVIKT